MNEKLEAAKRDARKEQEEMKKVDEQYSRTIKVSPPFATFVALVTFLPPAV